MMLGIFVLLVLFLGYAHCSLVVDSISQKGIYVSDFCPKMKHCAEGTHVMCMYYDPNRLMGTRCNKPKNVTVTPDLAEKLLEISNAIRSKIALGKEKGKGGDFLPKGYGMFRLKWDNELATFAQVLANQCVLRHDMCRASKRFSDPGQTAGLVRFSFPDWIPMSKSAGLDTKGLTKSKLIYAITQALKSWYGQKEGVTPGMIHHYPDWTENPNDQHGRLYLEMIYGPATHMGCGISAYTEYAYYDNKAALNYNSVQIICNYSKRSHKGEPVYEINPPTVVGYTIKCGCPEGMDEDADCLCFESTRNAIRPTLLETCTSKDHNCKPAVVLLPIFTVENAPPEKLIARSGYEADKKESEMEIMDLCGPDNNTIIHPIMPIQPNQNMITRPIQNVISSQAGIPNILSNTDGQTNSLRVPYSVNSLIPGNNGGNKLYDYKLPNHDQMFENQMRITGNGMLQQAQEPQSVINNLINEVRPKMSYPMSSSIRPHIQDVKNRFFDKKLPQHGYRSSIGMHSNHGHPQIKKESVFSKVATFELPKKGEKVLKADVPARKDFSKVKSLVKSYLESRRHREDNKKDYPKSSIDFLNFLKGHSGITETYLNSAEEKVMNYNYYSKNKFEPKVNRSNNVFSDFEESREKSNDKLMNLLDKLEQEVKHIELDKTKKEMFDAKIRKIYGSVVGRIEIFPHKFDRELTDMELTDTDNDRIGYSDIENGHSRKSQHHVPDEFETNKMNEHDRAKHDKHESSHDEIRPIARNQNDIIDIFKDKSNKDYRNTKKNYDTEIEHPFADRSKYKHNTFNDGKNIKTRNSYSDKDTLRTRHIFSDTEEKTRINDLEKRNSHLSFSDHEDDPLGGDRRRFYQEKLDKIERKLHNTRKHKANQGPVIRPIIRPSRPEQSRTSKIQVDQFYMPDRARFLHGF